MLRTPPGRPGSLALSALRGALLGAALAVGLHFAVILAGTNFRTILPGVAYRSGQLSPASLESFVRRHGIRTVVNLRGCCVSAKWYRDQADATARLDINQEDISFSATRMPSTASLRHLIEVLDRCEYPILVHCQQGADRTGLASVVILLLRTDAPLEVALRQLGPASGHVPFGRTAHIDRLFALYRDWLGETGRRHSPAVFRLWADEHYCPGAGRADFELVDPTEGPVRMRAGVGRQVTVRCRNASRADWRFEPGVTAGHHALWRLLDRDERAVLAGRTGLRRAVVPPGESIDLAVPLPALPPGRYTLYVDLTEEQQATFQQLGNEMLAVPVEVSP